MSYRFSERDALRNVFGYVDMILKAPSPVILSGSALRQVGGMTRASLRHIFG